VTDSVDVMAFGPHPDDVELGCGGTLIKLTDLGYSVVLVDLTEGEMSTRGTVETRRQEAAQASDLLGAVARENLGLEDGNIRNSQQARHRVVTVVRNYRPRMVLVPYYRDRHPDHYHASELLYDAVFLAGLRRLETGQESYRPEKFAYYMRWYEFDPTFIVDISNEFERKMEAIAVYASQFSAEDASFAQTRLTSPQHQWEIVHRCAYYGSLIGRQYGEGFLIRGRLEVADPLQATFSSF
jgi:bacillithiol biosynthesis deacetylase BshB1